MSPKKAKIISEMQVLDRFCILRCELEVAQRHVDLLFDIADDPEFADLLADLADAPCRLHAAYTEIQHLYAEHKGIIDEVYEAQPSIVKNGDWDANHS